MNHVSEHPGFAEKNALLEKARERYDALQKERLELIAKMEDLNEMRRQVAPREKAVASFLNDEEVPESIADIQTELRVRLEKVGDAIDYLYGHLKDLPTDVEYQRQVAQRERIAELSEDFDKVGAKFQLATKLLREACKEEDDLILQKLALCGFSTSDPMRTQASWLRRDFLMNI